MESSAQWKQLLSIPWEHSAEISFAVCELQAITNGTALLRASKRTIRVCNKLPGQSQRVQLEAGSAFSFLSHSPEREILKYKTYLQLLWLFPPSAHPIFAPFACKTSGILVWIQSLLAMDVESSVHNKLISYC